MTKVLIGIDFIGINFPAALYSIQQWWNFAIQSKEHFCILGVSNFANSNIGLPGTKNIKPTDVFRILSEFVPRDQIVQWTSDIDAELLDIVKKNGCRSQPVYPDFNYGSVVNRLLLLAYAHGCDYLVRIDPGTQPPKEKNRKEKEREKTFEELMCEHQDKIQKNPKAVISRKYDNRLALRDMFVLNTKKPPDYAKEEDKEKQDEHATLVGQATGIKVYHQITGGAMFTFRTPGTPAVCFPKRDGGSGSLVWASDDGIYQVLDDTKGSEPFDDYPVKRFDPEGKPKPPKEYYRGILGAVVLKEIREGTKMATINTIADAFVNKLREEYLDSVKCEKIDPNWLSSFTREQIAPDDFIKAIMVGWNNHKILLTEWDKICEVVKPYLLEKTSAKNRIDAN